MNKIAETEQWLLDGQCNKCRRDKYCSKMCSKAQIRQTREINDYLARRTGLGIMLSKDMVGGGAYREVSVSKDNNTLSGEEVQ